MRPYFDQRPDLTFELQEPSFPTGVLVHLSVTWAMSHRVHVKASMTLFDIAVFGMTCTDPVDASIDLGVPAA